MNIHKLSNQAVETVAALSLTQVFTEGEPSLSSRNRSRSLLFIGLLTACVCPAASLFPQNESASASDPATLFSQAMQAMRNGQFQTAEELFRRVIALDPNSSAAHINLGVTYMREHRWDAALIELHHAELLAPNLPGIQLNLGLAYYRGNDFDAAIAPFTKTLELQPDSLQAAYLLGLCYFFTNKYAPATEALAPLWERESTNLNYLYVLSIAASKSANASLQKRAFDRMIEIGKDTPEFHLYVGKAFLAEHNTDKALAEFQTAAAAKPELPLVHYFLGRTYLERYSYTEAEAELKKDAALEPDFAYSYEELGILYLKLGQAARAEAAFQQAIEHNQQLVNSYFALAKVYRDAARYKDAMEMLHHAETLAPKSASVHFTMGQVMNHLGQRDQAKQEFDTAAKLLKSFNDRLQQDPAGDQSADAQNAAQQ